MGLGVDRAGEIGSSQPLVLNASASMDLDGFTAVPWQFSWTCTAVATQSPCVAAVDGSVLDLTGFSVSGSSLATLSLPGGSLHAGVYSFGVVATKGSVGGRIPWAYRVSRWVQISSGVEAALGL